MIDQAETNQSTNKLDPKEMQQRLVTMRIGCTTAWWKNTSGTKREKGDR
jgi:hypothetical protein